MPTKQTRRIPAAYRMPDHLGRIARSAAFADAAAKVGLRSADFEIELSRDLKALIAAHTDAEVAAFEEEVSAAAIDATVKRIAEIKAS